MVSFILNNQLIAEVLPASLSVLDYLRQQRYLTDTKAACHEGECGSCTVLLGCLQDNEVVYQTVTACLLSVAQLQHKHLVTISGLNQNGLNPLQQAFVDNGAVQCGYCTPGFMMALTGYFLSNQHYTVEQTILAVSGNICRCTGYQGIKRAIAELITNMPQQEGNELDYLIAQGVLPAYFATIKKSLQTLATDSIVNPDTPIIIGGGTDYFVQHPDGKEQNFNFLLDHPELKGISIQNNVCCLGAATTIEELHDSGLIKTLLPHLEVDLNHFASPPLRHRATLAGNIVNASPIADMSIILLALNAELEIVDNHIGDSHRIALKDFFLGYKKIAIKPGQIIKTINFNLPSRYFHFEKVSKRQYLDIASVNSAFQLQIENGIISHSHLAIGGVAPIPLYLQQTVAYLQSQAVTPETVKTAAAIAEAEISPISDIRGSIAYKKLLVRQLIYAHFLSLFPQSIVWEQLQ